MPPPTHDLTAAQLEQITRIVVTPVVQAVRTEISSGLRSIADDVKDTQEDLSRVRRQVEDHDEQLAQLHRERGKVMAVWGVISLAVAGGLSWLWDFLRSRFGG